MTDHPPAIILTLPFQYPDSQLASLNQRSSNDHHQPDYHSSLIWHRYRHGYCYRCYLYCFCGSLFKCI